MLAPPVYSPSPVVDIRLRGAAAMNSALWAILVIGLAAAVAVYLRQSSAKTREEATLSLLHSEPMAFLVARRCVTQIVVEVETGDWLGNWRGVLWATVQFHYGLDLKKVRPEDVRRQGDVIIVRLPEPELLDFAVEPGSEGFLSKSTAIPKIVDLLRNGHRREMEQRLRQRALEFAGRQGLLPEREELVRELNAAAAALGMGAPVTLLFE